LKLQNHLAALLSLTLEPVKKPFWSITSKLIDISLKLRKRKSMSFKLLFILLMAGLGCWKAASIANNQRMHKVELF